MPFGVCFDPLVGARALLFVICIVGASTSAVAAWARPPVHGPKLGQLLRGPSGGAGADSGLASARDGEIAELVRRFNELQARADAQVASAATAQGRQEIERARTALAQAQPHAAARAKQIAWAALELATRLLARHRAELAHSAAERRATDAERRIAEARSAAVALDAQLAALRAKEAP